MALDDVHTVPPKPDRPIDTLGLASAAPIELASTVTLTEPLLAMFVAVALLADSDPPA